MNSTPADAGITSNMRIGDMKVAAYSPDCMVLSTIDRNQTLPLSIAAVLLLIGAAIMAVDAASGGVSVAFHKFNWVRGVPLGGGLALLIFSLRRFCLSYAFQNRTVVRRQFGLATAYPQGSFDTVCLRVAPLAGVADQVQLWLSRPSGTDHVLVATGVADDDSGLAIIAAAKQLSQLVEVPIELDVNTRNASAAFNQAIADLRRASQS